MLLKRILKYKKTKETIDKSLYFMDPSISGQVGIIRRIAGGEQIEKKQNKTYRLLCELD